MAQQKCVSHNKRVVLHLHAVDPNTTPSIVAVGGRVLSRFGRCRKKVSERETGAWGDTRKFRDEQTVYMRQSKTQRGILDTITHKKIYGE